MWFGLVFAVVASGASSSVPWPLTQLPVTTGGAGRPGGTVLLTAFGGRAGHGDNTMAFANALTHLAAAGGGTLVVPNPSAIPAGNDAGGAGGSGSGSGVAVYRSMPITIRSNFITLRLEAGVRVSAICDIPNWPTVPGFDSFSEGTDYAPFVSAAAVPPTPFLGQGGGSQMCGTIFYTPVRHSTPVPHS